MTTPNPAHLLQKAIALHNAGKLPEVEAIYRQILLRDPAYIDALHLLGVLAKQTGHNDVAIDLIAAAVRLKPDFAEGHYNLGITQGDAGRLDAAIVSYQRAIKLRPDHPESHNNLGNAFRDKGQFDQAIASCRRAIELKSDYAEAHYNLACALVDKERFADAIASFQRAIDLKPEFAEAHNNLGNSLWFTAQNDLANFHYDRALSLNPNLADAHLNLGMARLSLGDYQRGWSEYEWRWRVPRAERPFRFPQPQWDGKPLNGRTILIHAEQGFGDSIHFIRYASLVAARGGRIILGCQSQMARLLGTFPGIQQIFTSPADLPNFDVQCPLPSLPFAMGLLGPEDIPWTGPYLKSDPENRQKFSDCLHRGEGKLKVGLAWHGRPKPPGRAIPLQMLAPLAHPNIQFYSLQLGEGSQQAKNPPPGMNLIDATSRISDFADTAALIDQLDLIVTIDTAAAQLAGALGKPVWTLLKHVPDWRWLKDRPDSPWYPTMRLFRQQTDGDWPPVIASVAQALHARISE